MRSIFFIDLGRLMIGKMCTIISKQSIMSCSVAALLPPDIWLNVLSLCSPFEVANFMKINQTCHSIGACADTWRNLVLRHNLKARHTDNYGIVVSSLCNACFDTKQRKPKKYNRYNLCYFCAHRRGTFDRIINTDEVLCREITIVSKQLDLLKSVRVNNDRENLEQAAAQYVDLDRKSLR